jgi:hypothetical protein
MQTSIYCFECDELLKIALPEGTKYATRVAKHQHAVNLHKGDMSVYRVSLNKGMSSGELKHLQEFIESRPKLEINKFVKESVESFPEIFVKKSPEGDAFTVINKLLDKIQDNFPEMLQGEVRLLERLSMRRVQA